MDRSGIFVDAGYLFAAAGRLCCGTGSRSAINLDAQALTEDLATWVDQHSGGMDSLRTYWYDGARNGVPSPDQELIGGLSYVKLRLGRLIQGEQKGVDALIYRDLMTLARERAIARAYLLSGDEDLREGVVAAQDMGVQVVLLGIPTSQRTNQSAALVREADEHVVLPKSHWERFFTSDVPAAPGEEPTPAAAQAAGRAFGMGFAQRATSAELASALEKQPRIPRDLDAQLLAHAERTVGPLLGADELRREIRAGFWASLEASAKG